MVVDGVAISNANLNSTNAKSGRGGYDFGNSASDIDPNNKVLPKEWLVPANKKTSFMARTSIDVYHTDRADLADKIRKFDNLPMADVIAYKILAREIAVREYSSEAIIKKWNGFLSKIGAS